MRQRPGAKGIVQATNYETLVALGCKIHVSAVFALADFAVREDPPRVGLVFPRLRNLTLHSDSSIRFPITVLAINA